MKFLHRISDGMEKILNALGGILIGVSTLLAFIEVLFRYFLGLSHSWVEEIIIYSVIYGIFFISGPNLKRGLHINIDLLISRLSSSGRRTMNFIANGVGLFTSLFLTYTGIRYVVYLKKVGVLSTSSMEAPMYLILLIFPMGMGLLAFFYFEQLIFLFERSGKLHRSKKPGR